MGRAETKNMRNPVKTKHKKKDLDEIDEDLKTENADKLLTQDIDYDKPGNGQFYCLHCARYFINNQALKEHFRTKLHKRRMKALETEPYSQEEADRAAGMGSYTQPSKRKMETRHKTQDMDSAEDLPIKKKKK